MQVSETHDHVNHAIIGGQASIEMGISTSAEFFNILSTTLYKDQMLAVVREVLCNAWDSHIESGIKDTPISITINKEQFIVKDFGKAIHHDDIGPIYGVYGNSTKKNDGTQTGGFGLGCKAPFAYTDHFEVTSCHEGVKTIYHLSKAAIQSNGKPAIIPIASFPTTETGLTVKIDIKNTIDYSRFLSLTERIVHNGEMLAKINEITKPRLGFDSAVRNYYVYRDINLLNIPSSITVRYGNVIYPVDSSKELSDPYNAIIKFLNKLNTYPHENSGYKILFQAPPHSLSVTPSRESLSMQEHTVKTLLKMFDDFLVEMKANFQMECDSFAETTIQMAVEGKLYKTLLSRACRLPVELKSQRMTKVLPDWKAMAEQYMTATYPKDLEFRKIDWKCRVMLMSQEKLVDRGMAQTWLKEIDNVTELNDEYHWNRKPHAYPWLGRRIIAPLIGKLNMDPNMKADKLYVIDTDDVGFRHQGRDPGLIQAKKIQVKHHFYTASYLRNIIVISRRKFDIHNRVIEHEVFKKFGESTGYLFYHVGLKVEDAVNARAFFAKTGMNVVDMIDRQDWEELPISVIRKSDATLPLRKPRSKGLVTVKSLLQHGRVNTDMIHSENAERLEKPEYVVRIYKESQNNSTSFLNFLNGDQAQVFAELYGDRGCATLNKIQYNNYIKKGARTLQDFLLDEIVSYFYANLTEIKKWWSCYPNRIVDHNKAMGRLDYEQQNVLKAIYKIPELATQYQVTATLTDTSNKYVRLYDAVVGNRYHNNHPAFTTLKGIIDQIILSKDNQLLFKKLTECKLLNMLDGNDLYEVYNRIKTKPTQLASFLSIVTTILNS
jgi:hypothetical protein